MSNLQGIKKDNSDNILKSFGIEDDDLMKSRTAGAKDKKKRNKFDRKHVEMEYWHIKRHGGDIRSAKKEIREQYDESQHEKVNSHLDKYHADSNESLKKFKASQPREPRTNFKEER